MRRACAWLVCPLVACTLLLTCAHASASNQVAPGVCSSVDIRNSPSQFHKLAGCRVIEGQLSIVLLEHATYKEFDNMSFPELREVTGFIQIYRLKGVKNLGNLFPNLSVVRGLQLFREYAIVVFDNTDFEMLGLRSLTTIEHGAVRIQNNDKLCYTNTVDWNRIIRNTNAPNNIIRSNYDTRLCGLCPSAQCPTDPTGRRLCWDDKHCQKVCPSSCGDGPCMANGTCCNETCLGGCDGPTPWDCHVCRHFSFGNFPKRNCVKSCPSNTYELHRRCVTEQECRDMPPPVLIGKPDPNPPKILAYKIHNNTQCVWTCPSGYMEFIEAGGKATCQRCKPSGCVRECLGGKIDMIRAAEQFRGCTRLKGTLTIALRTGGGNTMTTLEETLGEIREIHGGLKVARSNPLVSLMFLKNLEKIVATPGGDNKGQALHIFNNANLELLWDWTGVHKNLRIEGPLYIHFNPKLCYSRLEHLKQIMGRNLTDVEVSEDNNGDQASCYQDTLHLEVQTLFKNVAILTWSKYCVEDSRKLLGYSIYYIVAEDKNMTFYEQRDACSDTWNVLDLTSDEVKHVNSTREADPQKYELGPCKNGQPGFYLVPNLIPYTRYAAYVKTYMTLQDKRGAQSPIIYFRTLPGDPSPPQGLMVEPDGPHSVTIKWEAPLMPNGTIFRYHVEIQANTYNQETIIASNTNYCSNPSQLANLISVRGVGDGHPREKPEEKYSEAKNGTCSCKVENKVTKFDSIAEAERRDSIDFENELQNRVYLKSINKTGKTRAPIRLRRSVETSLSMLVILSGNSEPQLGTTYTNVRDEKNYVKSMYFELDGSTRNLTVRELRHFTWYTVNVWACRLRQANETEEEYAKTWCSKRSHNTFRTLELPNADVVHNVRAEVLPSNKSFPEVNVTWQQPRNPNGFVVAYSVLHSLVVDNPTQDWPQTCLPASQCKEHSCGFVLSLRIPGNYSIRVTPITVNGAGNTSAVVYVDIKSESRYEWIWGVVGGCVIMILVLGGGIWYARRGFLPPAEANKLFASVNPEYVSTVYVPDEWEVPRGNIEFIRELGQGSFGMVYEGIAKGIEKGKPETRCAVKTVNEHATDRERIEFLNEASVMKAFDTYHVVRLLGVVSRGQPTLVIMELMEHGDLKTYLRSHRPDLESSLPKKDATNNPPTLQNILQMAIEIADGMAYLSAKKFVHRDLAARNCMVAGDLTVKVGDFGMTRDIYETDYYRKGTKGLLPVRWMSPESLKDGVFSSSSDVWSFGVVLWEMATLAMQPYQGLSNEQVVRYVSHGGVMERPEHCPDRLYELMRACWAHRPTSRPTFLQLAADLAPSAPTYFRHRSFFHSPLGQEVYALQRTTIDEEQEMPEVNVGAVATGSGSNLFGVSGRLASWVRELSSLRSRTPDDAAAEPLQPAPSAPLPLKGGPNGVLRDPDPACTGC